MVHACQTEQISGACWTDIRSGESLIRSICDVLNVSTTLCIAYLLQTQGKYFVGNHCTDLARVGLAICNSCLTKYGPAKQEVGTLCVGYSKKSWLYGRTVKHREHALEALCQSTTHEQALADIAWCQ